MSEWWTYRLSDFLMFAPRTYYRLFELYNAEIWPLPLAGLALGAAVCCLIWRGGAASGRIIAMILGAAWLFVGWAYHWQRYATINWGAEYYAAGFAVEGLLLIGFGATGTLRSPRPDTKDAVAALLLAAGLLYPLIAPLAGRPWSQAEIFGIAPDPTAIATLGALLLLADRAGWLLIALPVLWCAITAATLWTMETPEALVPAAAVVLALARFRLPVSPPSGK
jgi:uncharacterized protein DUF6064